MAPKSILDLPVTVREQIYTELLAPPVARENSYILQPNDLATNILYTNRQIHAESSDIFYSKNLFIIIHLNNYSPFYVRSTIKRYVFCTLVNQNQAASNGRFAMSMELLSIRGRSRPPQSLPSIVVVTASALVNFIACLEEDVRRSTQATVAQFQISNTFRYTTHRFSELVFGRLLSMPYFPAFKALSIRGPIDPTYHKQLISKLPDDQDSLWFNFAGVFAGHIFRVENNLFPMRQTGEPAVSIEENIAESRLLLRVLDIVWDFHAHQGFRCNKDYARASLFHSVADVHGVLVLAHLFRAKQRPYRAIDSYLDARRAAEEGITYLKRDDRFVDEHAFEDFPPYIKEQNDTMISLAKATLSLKASEACIKLGDETAAREYISDAFRFNSTMYSTRQELLKLTWKKMPDARKGPFVLWNHSP